MESIIHTRLDLTEQRELGKLKNSVRVQETFGGHLWLAMMFSAVLDMNHYQK